MLVYEDIDDDPRSTSLAPSGSDIVEHVGF